MSKNEISKPRNVNTVINTYIDLSTTFEDVISQLEEIKTDHPNLTNLSLEVGVEDDSVDVTVWGSRLETPEETKSRNNAREVLANRTKERKLQQYKLLKKELGID